MLFKTSNPLNSKFKYLLMSCSFKITGCLSCTFFNIVDAFWVIIQNSFS